MMSEVCSSENVRDIQKIALQKAPFFPLSQQASARRIHKKRLLHHWSEPGPSLMAEAEEKVFALWDTWISRLLKNRSVDAQILQSWTQQHPHHSSITTLPDRHLENKISLPLPFSTTIARRYSNKL